MLNRKICRECAKKNSAWAFSYKKWREEGLVWCRGVGNGFDGTLRSGYWIKIDKVPKECLYYTE